KEVNRAVKEIVLARTDNEYDGADLMNRAFSPANPVVRLADLSTLSGQDEQKGYMLLFAGTMTGIRNPKAHANLTIERGRAVHLLFLASLLMFKLDERKDVV
ncbi:MAG TPA: TIGR02391 family protein, partial [Candidatus Hodarchaeales archaeon]|nr:TIGR02391 family protein [Candidatus Hodarchaeales archaeon]